MRDAVKRADPETARAVLDQAVAARAHFTGSLVGEGDGENGKWRSAFDFEQPRDAMHQHARLARTRAGKHKIMAERRTDSVALRRVEIV